MSNDQTINRLRGLAFQLCVRLIQNPGERDAILDGLRTPEDLVDPRLRSVFEAVRWLHEKNRTVEPIAIEDAAKKLQAVDPGGALLEELGSATVTESPETHNLVAHLERGGAFRRLEELSRDALRQASEGRGDPVAIAETLSAAYAETATAKRRAEITSWREGYKQFLGHLEAARAGDQRATGILTGWDKLDAILGPLKAGQLIIVAAGTSVGKSAFALNLVLSLADRGFYSLIASLEMTVEELIERGIAFDSGIGSHLLSQPGLLSRDQYARIFRAASRQSELPIGVLDSSDLSLAGIRSQARFAKRQGRLDLLVVDYLQLMDSETSGRAANREREVAAVSRGLKKLSKELEVPVVALSQLNRDQKKRTGPARKPQLHDLRESGAIEQDADKVIMIHRELDEENSAEADVLVRKNRKGPLGEVPMIYDATRTRFRE